MAISARELTLILRVQSAGANNIRAMAADLNSLERSGASMNDKFKLASQSLGAVGKQLQLAGGIGTFALGLAANEAAKLQTSVTLAATQVANSTAKVKTQATSDMQGILDQMTKFPTTADDMSKALYDIYSTLNVTGKQGIPILNQVNKAAVAGGLSAQDAANGLLSIASNFNKGNATIKSVREEFNRMFAAVRFGRVNMAQFSTSLQTTAPAAKLAGQSLNSMAGTVAFLSRSLGANKASVGYARLVEVLSSPQMQDGLKKVGVNIDTSNGKLMDLDKVIQTLVHHFPYLAQGGIKAINFFKDIGNIQSTIQARRAFATLVKDVGGYRMILGKTVNDNKEFAKSYKTMSQSLGVQWQVFLNTLKSLAITVGLAVIPAFVEMSKPIKEAVAWFQKLDPATKNLLGRFAAFAAVGALVGGTLLTIVAGTAVLVASLPELALAAGALLAGLVPFLSFAAVAKKIYDNWDKLGPMFMKLGTQLKNIFVSLGEAAKAFYEGDWNQLWSHLGDAIQQAIPAVKTALDLLLHSVIEWGKEFVTTLQGAITAGLAGMFAVAKGRGALGGGGERLLGGLSTADLMTPFLGVAGGPMGMGIKAAAKSDDLKQLAKYIPYMSTQEKLAYTELATRQKIANSWRTQVSNMANAMTARKQLAALDAVEAKKLYSFSNVATGRTQIMRTTGGFASAAESTAALAILNKTPGAAGASEKAAAAAAISFAKLSGGIKGAGTSLLQFIGFGNIWIGAGVAMVAGLAILVSALGTAGSAFARASAGLKQYTDQLSKFTDTIKNAADAQIQFGAAKTTLQEQTQQVAHLQHIVQTATVGSKAYRDAEKQLAAVQQARAQSVNTLANAQEILNSALGQSLGHAVSARQGLRQALANIPAARAGASAQTAQTRREQFGFGTIDPQISQNAAQVKKLNAQIQATTAWLGKATAGFDQFARVGGNIQSGFGLKALNTISQIMSETLVGTDKLAPSITKLSQLMGRVVTPQEMRYFGQLNKNIIPGITRFVATAHQMPGSMTTNFLAAHKQIQQSAGAIIGTTGRLPDTKTLKFLVDHRQYDSQIADYIKKYHQLPDKKHMTIIVNTVQAEHNLVKAQQHVGQLQRNLHQVGRIRTDMKVNTSLFDRNIAKAKHNITSLDGLVTKPHTKNYNITWHPSIGKAASQASGLGASLDAGVAAGITSNTAVMNSAMSAAVASAIAAGVKAAGAHSPSKVAEKKIGDPIIQGIIQGIGKGKGALNSAMQSAVGNMISQFNTLKDTFQGQLGDLFTGVDKFGQSDLQQKIDWGEKLNISDLMKNVRLQNHTFGQFEHNLNRLQRRRGVTRPFVEMLRQLGPAAEPEVEAMLRATPKQIRKYVKMWEQGQKMVNNTAKKSMSNTMKIWKKQGEAVAFGFMSGMEAHSAQMARFFERMFMNLYRHVKHVHKSHSPSKLYFEEGVNVMQGFALGVEHGASRSNVTRHFSPVGRYHHRGPLVAPVTNNYYYNKTYNVYPQKNENLLSALRKHDHVTRNRP